jgi:hypothetical protein
MLGLLSFRRSTPYSMMEAAQIHCHRGIAVEMEAENRPEEKLKTLAGGHREAMYKN